MGVYPGPLAGLNVIDFGHYYAGPMMAMLLADQGANVIRIVRPFGPTSWEPEIPSPQYRLLNRNKKILTLNLKTQEGKEQALALIDRADVVIENFRPGVMKRLGLDYLSVKDRNPGLVYVSLPGFASTDTERASIQAWEGVINAAAGSFSELHWFRQALGYPPVYTWVPLCSAHGSMQGAIALLAALIARESHGQGTVIEVPLVDAALAGVTPIAFGRCVSPWQIFDESGRMSEVFKSFAFSPADSEDIQLDKLDSVTRAMAFSPILKAYPCADGREILLWVQAPDRFFKALNLGKQLIAEGIDVVDVYGALSSEHRRRVEKLVAEKLLSKTAQEWEVILGDELGVAAAIIRERAEWMRLEPMLKSGIFARMNDGKSELTVPGNFADVSGPGNAVIENPFREPQAITVADAMALLGPRTVKQIPISSIKKGELLCGLKVLDLTNLVAGPTSTYTLAQYGAEVIKADPPNSANVVHIGATMLEVNQGKRSILTDLTTAPGREIFRRLVSWADLVVHNSVDGVAERLGVTQKQLQDINPKVVVCQFSAYGGTYRNRGGWEKRPGFDSVVQGVSGMMAHYGKLDKPQFHGMISCGDIMGGIGGSFAALLGVYQQRKSGYAGEARSSLARMINYIQLPGMIVEEGSSDWGEARGQFTLGERPWRRLYQCSDRWIYVETTEGRAELLAKVVTGQKHADTAALASAFAGGSYSHWLAKLAAVDIGCHLVVNRGDLLDRGYRMVSNDEADETAGKSIELLCREHHPAGIPIVFPAPSWVRVGENQSYKRLTPAPRYGQHTQEILRKLGYGEDEIRTLIDLKVSHEYLPALGSQDIYFLGQERRAKT